MNKGAIANPTFPAYSRTKYCQYMAFPEERIMTVSELNTLVNAELSQMAVRVRGEISDLRVNGKFVYFDLKDDSSRINCFMMSFQLHQQLEDGMEAIVAGSPGVYVPYGKYTFRARTVEPVGEGALRRAFELTRRKLEEEGLFSEEHKKPLPRFPERIGLITSREAAAYSDFLRILRNRWCGVEISFIDVAVQGEDAAEEIAGAIETLNTHMPAPDVLALVRGGGSLEDLAAFNDEHVARAIFASRIPMVVGVGHERDTTLADMAADVRASTPSNAAERIVPDRSEIGGELEMFFSGLDAGMERSLRNHKQMLDGFLARIESVLREKTEKGRLLSSRLEAVFSVRFRSFNEKLLQSASLLRALNPAGILRRGYSITLRDGKVVKGVSEVKRGDKVKSVLFKGFFESVVE
jgi:exodeoxyribonuclease VII large subunit